MKRLWNWLRYRLAGKTHTIFEGDNCGAVEPEEGACIWPRGHRGRHWYSMFGEPHA